MARKACSTRRCRIAKTSLYVWSSSWSAALTLDLYVQDTWLGKLRLHAFEKSLTDYCSVGHPWCDWCRRHAIERPEWDSAMRQSMRDWTAQTAGSPFHKQISGCAGVYKACAMCKATAGARFDQAYRDSAPEFPL